MRQVEGALAQVRESVPVLEAGLDAAMNALDVILGTPPGTHRAELADIQSIPVVPKIEAMGTLGWAREASRPRGRLRNLSRGRTGDPRRQFTD